MWHLALLAATVGLVLWGSLVFAQKDKMSMGEQLSGTVIRKGSAPVLSAPPSGSKVTGELDVKINPKEMPKK